MREKLFSLTHSERDDLWRRYKQTSDHHVAERLHAILLLDEGRSAHEVGAILHLHPKTLKCWAKIFVAHGLDGLSTFNYVGNTPWLIEPQTTRPLPSCGRPFKSRWPILAATSMNSRR